MRVLHIAQGAPGGIGRVENLLGAVWERDQRVEVTTVRRMTYPGYLQPTHIGTPGTAGRLRWAATILRSLIRTRADVLILNHLNLTPIAIPFRVLRPRGRLIVWVYGMEAWRPPSFWQRAGLRLVDQAWSISEYTAREFINAAGFPPNRIAVVPLALTPQRARALGLPAGRAADRPSSCDVLTVSRLWRNESKGIDHLIEAIASVTPRVRLIVVGDGDDRPRLERLALKAGVAERVIFTGQTDDETLTELYRRCPVFALPSSREGFGLVFLEAMAAGKPVVAARAGAVPELVSDGETGLLVPFHDCQALAGAINSLIQDPDWAASLGERGRRRAERDFAFNRFAHQVIDLLVALHAA